MSARMNTENMSGLIDYIMRSHNLHVTELRERARVHRKTISPFSVHGRGSFQCDECPNTFTSLYSWMTIDLDLQMVTKKWTMKCKGCRREIVPTFDLYDMVERACKEFKQERPVKTYRGLKVAYPDPHYSELCEKCAWGREKCWKAPRYVPSFRIPQTTPVNGNHP